MCRNMRKPPDLTTKTYVKHLIRINDQELPLLPPLNLNQGLSEYELNDIIHNGLPPSWKNKMICQGFNFLMRSLEELVYFCKLQEATTSMHEARTNTKDNKKTHKPHQQGTAKAAKWCEYHKSKSHNTADCHAMNNQGKNHHKYSICAFKTLEAFLMRRKVKVRLSSGLFHNLLILTRLQLLHFQHTTLAGTYFHWTNAYQVSLKNGGKMHIGVSPTIAWIRIKAYTNLVVLVL